jgi:hypothetical protein
VVPETVGALLVFLAFIVPGLAFELLRERRRPFVEETAFREASRIGLSSMLFSGTALVVVGVARAAGADWVVDPAAWLRGGNTYAADNLDDVARTVIAVVLTALTFALLADVAFSGRGGGRIVTSSIWFVLFRRSRPDKTTPWVHIRLKDKTEVWGYAGPYITDAKLENRELIVEQPKLEMRKDDGQPEQLSQWAFVTVRGEEISWMKVTYVAADGSVAEPRQPPPPMMRRFLAAVVKRSPVAAPAQANADAQRTSTERGRPEGRPSGPPRTGPVRRRA